MERPTNLVLKTATNPAAAPVMTTTTKTGRCNNKSGDNNRGGNSSNRPRGNNNNNNNDDVNHANQANDKVSADKLTHSPTNFFCITCFFVQCNRFGALMKVEEKYVVEYVA